MVWHLTGLEADTFLNGWTVRLAKGPLDGRVRYGKSAAGADALQNLAEIRTRMLIAIAAWCGFFPLRSLRSLPWRMLVEELKATETLFPGTKLQMMFQWVKGSNPADAAFWG